MKRKDNGYLERRCVNQKKIDRITCKGLETIQLFLIIKMDVPVLDENEGHLEIIIRVYIYGNV